MENHETGQQAELKAGLGAHVTIDLVLQADIERLEFDIVNDKEADFASGFLGVSTPLAQAVLGRAAHSVIPYRVNDAREVRIISVAPSQSGDRANAQKRHEEIVRRAVDQSDRTNAMIFASSFSGKWGDYDPTGFTEEEDPPK